MISGAKGLSGAGEGVLNSALLPGAAQCPTDAAEDVAGADDEAAAAAFAAEAQDTSDREQSFYVAAPEIGVHSLATGNALQTDAKRAMVALDIAADALQKAATRAMTADILVSAASPDSDIYKKLAAQVGAKPGLDPRFIFGTDRDFASPAELIRFSERLFAMAYSGELMPGDFIDWAFRGERHFKITALKPGEIVDGAPVGQTKPGRLVALRVESVRPPALGTDSIVELAEGQSHEIVYRPSSSGMTRAKVVYGEVPETNVMHIRGGIIGPGQYGLYAVLPGKWVAPIENTDFWSTRAFIVKDRDALFEMRDEGKILMAVVVGGALEPEVIELPPIVDGPGAASVIVAKGPSLEALVAKTTEYGRGGVASIIDSVINEEVARRLAPYFVEPPASDPADSRTIVVQIGKAASGGIGPSDYVMLLRKGDEWALQGFSGDGSSWHLEDVIKMSGEEIIVNSTHGFIEAAPWNGVLGKKGEAINFLLTIRKIVGDIEPHIS